MEEFGFSLPEVRNKIRILRTTFNQEKKKEETIPGYTPKLSWYNEMKTAFVSGNIKTYPRKGFKEERDDSFQLEFDSNVVHLKSEKAADRVKASSEEEIIIQPYEEYEMEEDGEGEEEVIEVISKNERQPTSSTSQQFQPTAPPHQTLSSNELFLYSLKSTFDKLPEDKNMRARIAIQEILYKIMFEK